MLKEKNVVAGELRRRKAWTTQFSKMKNATTIKEYLFEVSQLLAIPEYAKAEVVRAHAVTGKPLEIAWKKDHDSYLKSITLLSGTSRMAPEVLYPALKKMFAEIEDPRIYNVQDDIWLTLSREQVQTGGGHNDAPTYQRGLVIRVAHVLDITEFSK